MATPRSEGQAGHVVFVNFGLRRGALDHAHELDACVLAPQLLAARLRRLPRW